MNYKVIFFILILLSFSWLSEKNKIMNTLNNYNMAFGKSDYSEIVKYFDYPTSFNLTNKTINAGNRFKLNLIYRKIRGDLPDYYSYSKWDDISIELIDDNIAIVDADFSRYKENGNIFYSGSARYFLRLIDNKWKIFSLTPYTNSKILD